MSEQLFKISPARWSYRDFNEFLRLLRAGDLRGASKIASSVLVEWKFDIPLEGDNPISKLPLAEAGAVIRAIPDLCAELLETIPDEDFAVDLKNWTFEDFCTFSERGSEFDLDYIEAEMRRVGKINGKPLDSGTISYIEGAKLMKKIQSEVQKVLSGKN